MNQKKPQNEHCWVLIGSRRGPFWIAERAEMTVGSPTSVEFSPEWVIRRDEQVGDIVGFLHTHPSRSLKPSQRDIDTMRAWTSCLGRSLLCLIAFEEEVEPYLFEHDQCEGVPLEAAELFDDETVVIYGVETSTHLHAFSTDEGETN